MNTGRSAAVSCKVSLVRDAVVYTSMRLKTIVAIMVCIDTGGPGSYVLKKEA